MKDVLGQAMLDYQQAPGLKKKLWVLFPDGSKDEMGVGTYFRAFAKMPLLEQIALQECRGRVLDVGAGAGSHALWLQEKGLDVTALDASPGAAEVAQVRGVKQVRCNDIYAFRNGPFDTLLLLMNGIGLSGSLDGLRTFLRHAQTLLAPGGQLLFDSSNVAYLYTSNTSLPDQYYGEVKCRYQYGNAKTAWFTWLYVDQQQLTHIAVALGWQVQLLFEDDDEQYLVRLTRAEA